VKVLRIAALLHDAGSRVKFYDRYRHSLYFILNSNLYGVSHRDLVLAAFVAQGTRREEFSMTEWAKFKDLLREEDLVAVMRLGVILRIAESLDRTNMGLVKTLNCDVLGDSVIMKTEVEGDASLEIKDAMNAGTEFARAFRKNLEIL
jgi:exopolyphosphatase/guanosine-5'-triphosphate,3'-diphosphate pyrophosphatase